MLLPGDPFASAGVLLVFKPFTSDLVADALAISGKAISVPNLLVLGEAVVAFLAIALGSNLPA